MDAEIVALLKLAGMWDEEEGNGHHTNRYIFWNPEHVHSTAVVAIIASDTFDSVKEKVADYFAEVSRQ